MNEEGTRKASKDKENTVGTAFREVDEGGWEKMAIETRVKVERC